MANRKFLYTVTGCFLAVEVVLGVLLQRASGRQFALLAYGSVVLACLFFAFFFERSRSYLLTQIALVFTVCADYFLVWIEEQKQLPAMLFFSLVQIAYFLRLYVEEETEKRRRIHLLFRAGLSLFALCLTGAVLGEGADTLALVSMFYYANLATNLLFAFLRVQKQWLLAVGFLLFLLCDTAIGLSLLDGYLPVAKDGWLYRWLHPDFNLAWAFYLPSQVCLALSLLPKRLTKKENYS